MEIIHAKDETFDNELQADVPVWVDFYADWCGPCRMLAPVLQDISSERSNVKIVKVNVDEAEKVAQRFGIMSIPTLMVFKDGKEVSKKVGLCSKDEIVDMINLWLLL